MGIIVDMVVSTVCLVFASTVIGCSGMLAFVGELPDRLGLTTVGRGVAALLFAIPAATLGGCAIFSLLLAWLEDETTFQTSFRFVVSVVCGLGNPLTPWKPTGTEASFTVVVIGIAAQGLIGVIIGIAGGITPLVNAVARFDAAIHDAAELVEEVLPAHPPSEPGAAEGSTPVSARGKNTDSQAVDRRLTA
jgi:hypothetical protein